jgi:hypothetical protein
MQELAKAGHKELYKMGDSFTEGWNDDGGE